MKTTVTKQQARQFLLKKQILLTPRSLSGKTAIETVFNSLRVVQYDPLNPCGRNPDLVLQARIKDYHPNDYHHWLYSEKKGIDAYDKELCIIPIEDLEYTTHTNLRLSKDLNKKKFLKTYQLEISEILKQIAQNGPTSSSDIKIKKQVISGWGSTAQFGRIALELLWRLGQLVVVKREGMKKYYDLPSNVHPTLQSPIPLSEIKKEHIIRRINSVGILPKTTTGGGWQGLGGGTAKLINELLESKEIIEVEIQDCKLKYLIQKMDLVSIKLSPIIIENKISFIAPLDNLIWDRSMIEDIFDFHYRWEVYTPLAKRKFGYYVLPILFGDKFIGRIEPVKKKDILEIRGIWKESKWDKVMENEFQKALTEFSQYLQTSNIVIHPLNL